MAALTPNCTIITRLNSGGEYNQQQKHQLSVFNFTTSRNQKKRFPTTIRLGSTSNQNLGLYSAKKFDLTTSTVDTVLEDVRPYLISDGGNMEVVSVTDGVVSLKLEGACESCPSSTTTMKMGIECVLKEKFGDAIKDIVQVYDDDQPKETTVEVVNNHLEILRVESVMLDLSPLDQELKLLSKKSFQTFSMLPSPPLRL